jgi:hypothetical protein
MKVKALTFKKCGQKSTALSNAFVGRSRKKAQIGYDYFKKLKSVKNVFLESEIE